MSTASSFLLSILLPDATEGQKRFSAAIDAGITVDSFYDEPDRNIWNFIGAYFLRYRTIPTIDIVEVETETTLPRYLPEEPFEFWLDALLRINKQIHIDAGIQDVQELLERGKIGQAEKKLLEVSNGLSKFRRSKEVYTLKDLGEEIVEEHERIQRGLEYPGVNIGFPYIDGISGGAQPGDSWVFVGNSGSGKTYFLCAAGRHAHSLGRKVLFVSMEMPAYQIAQRQVAMGSGTAATYLRLGRMSGFGMAGVRNFVSSMSDEEASRFLILNGKINLSVDDILMKVREYSPDILLVDGAYMVKPGGKSGARAHWEGAMMTMEGLKQLAMEENIPVLSSYQFKRKGKVDGIDGIAYTSAVAQLASIVIAIDNEPASGIRYMPVVYKTLELLKGRQGETGKIRVEYNMAKTQIRQIEVLEAASGFESSLNERAGNRDPEPPAYGEDGDELSQISDPDDLL